MTLATIAVFFVVALHGSGNAQTRDGRPLEAGETAFQGPAVDSCGVDGAERGIAWSYGVSPSVTPGVFEVHYGQFVALRFPTTEAWHGATDGPLTKPNEFYATQQGGSLYLINPNTTTITAVGNYGGEPPILIRELGFKELNEVLYGTDYDKLYVINQATGVATLIGDMKDGVVDVDDFWAMDYDEASGELLAISEETNKLYKVDVTDASLTEVGPTTVTRLTDIWYDKYTGNIYAVSNGDAGNKHYIVNRDTGEATPLTGGAEFCCNLLGLGDVRYQGVPALTNWGLLVLLVLLVISGIIVIRHRRKAVRA